ncbi:hypothetical protein VTJ04DRAFT_515 [Mycothermus thermophilus]|uniref:uncharacterized protein n=1 Tax=Humicola insolens TaxID=85995 RepID=UPI0037445000
MLGPLLGLHLGTQNSRRQGLLKKRISFDIGGREYCVINYYCPADVLGGLLRRPRHTPNWPGITAAALPAHYWAQRANRRHTIANDNGVAPAWQTPMWSQAPELAAPVAPAQAAPQVVPAIQPPALPALPIQLPGGQPPVNHPPTNHPPPSHPPARQPPPSQARARQSAPSQSSATQALATQPQPNQPPVPPAQAAPQVVPFALTPAPPRHQRVMSVEELRRLAFRPGAEDPFMGFMGEDINDYID